MKTSGLSQKEMAKNKLKDAERLLGLYGNVEGHKGDKQREMDTVLQYLKYIYTTHPELFKGDKVYLWEQAAFAFEELGDLAAMEFCLRTQSKLQPGDAGPFLNMGALYYGRGYFRKALSAYLEGLMVDPYDEYIYHNLASLMMDNGHYSTAIQYINEAIEANPDRMINYKLKGDLCFRQHLYMEAVTEYKRALEIAGDDDMAGVIMVECYQSLAQSLDHLKLYREERDVLEEAYTSYPHHPGILLGLATVYGKRLGNFRKAVEMANATLNQDPTCVDAHIILAKCYNMWGDAERAIWHIKKAHQLEHNG